MKMSGVVECSFAAVDCCIPLRYSGSLMSDSFEMHWSAVQTVIQMRFSAESFAVGKPYSAQCPNQAGK